MRVGTAEVGALIAERDGVLRCEVGSAGAATTALTPMGCPLAAGAGSGGGAGAGRGPEWLSTREASAERSWRRGPRVRRNRGPFRPRRGRFGPTREQMEGQGDEDEDEEGRGR